METFSVTKHVISDQLNLIVPIDIFSAHSSFIIAKMRITHIK